MNNESGIFERVPPMHITTQLTWEAIVDVADRVPMGTGPNGERGMVSIVGGEFRGGPDNPAFSGKVLPGGADRQLLRADGVKELDAVYEMQVDDGTVISVRNRVLIDDQRQGERYAMSRIQLTAPQGKWEWLNRRVFLGTLQSARPERNAVIIRGWLAVAR
jgi:hypothetical protein